MKKNFIFKRGLKWCLALTFLVFSFQDSNAQICIQTGGDIDQIVGNEDGFRHELWNQNATGTACMTLGDKAAFSAEWSNIENYLARRGLGYDQTQKHQEIGTFHANFDVIYNPNCSSGNSYVGVYGWTYEQSTDDLVEYYIIEDWCNWIPSMDANAEPMGTIWQSGSYYDLIMVPKYDAPSILGDRDFMQYFSIRQDTRTSGLINISDHFYHWEEAGMAMGNMHEVSMLVEGYQNSGSAEFTYLDVYRTDNDYAQQIYFVEDSYNLTVGQQTSELEYYTAPQNAGINNLKYESSNPNVVSIGVYKGNYYLQANGPGTATITITTLTTTNTDTASVTVSGSSSAPNLRFIEFRALGAQGDEKLNLLLDGAPVGVQHTLTTDFQVYTDRVFGEGDISVEFVNDDNTENGRDVRLDYISIDGEKRETEDAENGAAYDNGVCGGGSNTEWLHCNGTVNYGPIEESHTITIRARGNNGGEHIDLLIDGQPVNDGWWLGTTYQEYTATVKGDGDINVEYDNDGGQRDVVIDWVKVDNQKARQAENMQYNTGAFANNQCGGGSYTQWLHCNGVIGFGNISDNFDAKSSVTISNVAETGSPETSTITVYPNPSSGDITIYLGGNNLNASVKIYNVAGKVVFAADNINRNEIHISDLQSGLYVVNINSNGFEKQSKVIVN